MEAQLTVNPTEFGLEESKATELTSGLTTILAEREILKDAYNDVIDLEITPENLETFKDLRIKIRDNRTKGILVWHKTNKEVYLRAGQFVDAVKNREIAENERMEEKLAAAEKHFENLEKERIKAIHNSRVEKLQPFGYEIGNTDFGMMDDNMFNAILTGAEKTHSDKIEAEKKAEAARLEAARLEAERIEAQRIENEKLKADAIEKEKQLKAEREAAELAAKEAKDKADAEAKKAQAIIDGQRKKLEAEHEAARQARLEVERMATEKDKAEKAAKDKLEADEKAKIAAELKAAKAPDKDKLTALINGMVFNSVALKGQDAQALQNILGQKFEAFKKWANEQISNL